MCICLCFGVSKSELKQAIRDGHDSVEKLSVHIQVGSHCGDGIGQIEKILEKKPQFLVAVVRVERLPSDPFNQCDFAPYKCRHVRLGSQ